MEAGTITTLDGGRAAVILERRGKIIETWEEGPGQSIDVVHVRFLDTGEVRAFTIDVVSHGLPITSEPW